MSALCRTQNSGFTERDCLKLEELEKIPFDERKNLLIDTEQLFSSNPKVYLNSFLAKLAMDGNCIYQKKAGYSFSEKTLSLIHIYAEQELINLISSGL